VEFREKLHRRLPCSRVAPSYLRRSLALLEPDLGAETLATLQLLLGELVTNSVIHADGKEIEVTVAVGDGRIRAEVKDEGRGFPVPPLKEDPSSTRGRGLLIVDRLADQWGMAGAGRTLVWFELPTRR
jgi:two-component sensor histidine kinase